MRNMTLSLEEAHILFLQKQTNASELVRLLIDAEMKKAQATKLNISDALEEIDKDKSERELQRRFYLLDHDVQRRIRDEVSRENYPLRVFTETHNGLAVRKAIKEGIL